MIDHWNSYSFQCHHRFLVARCSRIMGDQHHQLSDLRDGSRTAPRCRPLTLTTPPPTAIFVDFKPFSPLLWTVVPFFFGRFYAFCMNWTPPHLLVSSSQHTLSCSLAELPSQAVMSKSMPQSEKNRRRKCSCGCSHLVTRWTEWRHKKNIPSPPSPKRRRIAPSQTGQESSTTEPEHCSKQRQSYTDDNSPTSHAHSDASLSSHDHPQFSPQIHASSFEFDPSLPLLNSLPASNLPQFPGDACTEASGLSVDSILLNLHARTHRTTDQSDDEDSEDTLESDAVEAADSIDHETDGSWNGEDVVVQGDADPREGIVSDWDLLAEEFIAEAEELGTFEALTLSCAP